MAEVEFFGEKFGIVSEPNEFALDEFAAAAEDVESDSMAARAAIFRLVQESIVPEDWARFRACARKNRATQDQLLPVVAAVYEQATERPTGLPVDSSTGQDVTPLKSESKPADPVMERFEGRPDMQAAVLQMRAVRSA